jgi:type VI secretion system protein ImpC
MANTSSGTRSAQLTRLLQSMQLEEGNVSLTPMIGDSFGSTNEQVSLEDRFLSGLGAVLFNVDASDGRFEKGKVMEAIRKIDELVNKQLNAVFHHPTFQQLEATWRGIDDLAEHAHFRSNITIELLDVGKQELMEDFENNSSDIFGGSLFEKVYITEYDQYGGRPYGCILGLYEFTTNARDLFWLRNMSKIAAASHAPFVASVSPGFFGCKDIAEVEALKDLDGLLSQPRYSQWNALRDADEAAYIGLCFPRYVVRLPWNPETNPSSGLTFYEDANGEHGRYLWGHAGLLFARNLIRSFEDTGWCQYIRGPKGGGLITALPVDTFNVRGQEELRVPVELCIPDYRELEFARNGIIPLIYRKGSSEATFFSCQSIKRPKKFKDSKDSENSQLVCNMSYTFSITRIAHYIKSIMRDNIGDIATAGYVQSVLSRWLEQYVTTEVRPDDLTMRSFPFRAAQVQVEAKPGRLGWYDCRVSILPHIQFEGMDVELRLESRLG